MTTDVLNNSASGYILSVLPRTFSYLARGHGYGMVGSDYYTDGVTLFRRPNVPIAHRTGSYGKTLIYTVRCREDQPWTLREAAMIYALAEEFCFDFQIDDLGEREGPLVGQEIEALKRQWRQ